MDAGKNADDCISGASAIFQKIQLAREMLIVSRYTKEEYNQRIESYLLALREFLLV